MARSGNDAIDRTAAPLRDTANREASLRVNDPASETIRAVALYALSPYRVSPRLIRSVALVKEAAALCNGALGYLDDAVAAALTQASRRLRALSDDEIRAALPLDAFQGGAGTSTNMAVNEWLVLAAGDSDVAADAHRHANLHQSTNDVMPTALRLMMHDRFAELEKACETLQGHLQNGEERFDAILKPARTQLREALVTNVGREYGTWAHAVARDRWRCFKARERIREVNLGGTAIGTGAGAPRRYVLQVIRHLQSLVDHPITRAEHLVEATSNYDQIVEAMGAVKCLAVDLRRIASDLRLLASGPRAAVGEFRIPALLAGSSIMAGKINPVVPEAVVQAAERILANDALIARLAAMSELELNAFFPAIAHTVDESLHLAVGALRALSDYIVLVVPDRERCEWGLGSGYAEAVALLPLLGYDEIEALLLEAARKNESLQGLLLSTGVLTDAHVEALFAPANMTALGYDERLYGTIRTECGEALRSLVDAVIRGQTEAGGSVGEATGDRKEKTP